MSIDHEQSINTAVAAHEAAQKRADEAEASAERVRAKGVEARDALSAAEKGYEREATDAGWDAVAAARRAAERAAFDAKVAATAADKARADCEASRVAVARARNARAEAAAQREADAMAETMAKLCWLDEQAFKLVTTLRADAPRRRAVLVAEGTSNAVRALAGYDVAEIAGYALHASRKENGRSVPGMAESVRRDTVVRVIGELGEAHQREMLATFARRVADLSKKQKTT